MHIGTADTTLAGTENRTKSEGSVSFAELRMQRWLIL